MTITYASIFIIIGGILIIDPKLPRFSIRGKARELSQKIEQMSTKKRGTKETASEWLDRINGVSKESFASRSYHEARGVFEAIGQTDRYQKTLLTSFFCGLGGIIVGLLLQNVLLSVILAVGFYFLPLWLTRFSLYRYQRFVNEELETALSLVTTSYLRSSDLLSAIEENLPAVNDPVRTVFISFVNGLKYVDANAPAQIRRMKGMLDNPLFAEWCDALILCQENHLLQAALKPIVAKFSVLKAQQEANETRMMAPLRYAIMMAAMVVGFCPLMKLINDDWYRYLMFTPFGKVVLAGAAIAVFVTINKGITLSEPISYNV